MSLKVLKFLGVARNVHVANTEGEIEIRKAA
jgi:hypothetical protein